MAIVRLEGLDKLKNSTSFGLEPATFRLVTYYLNQLRYRVPQIGETLLLRLQLQHKYIFFSPPLGTTAPVGLGLPP
jgi:hypothetical protein